MAETGENVKVEGWKKLAGEYAVQFVEDGMTVGLGFGSTAVHALRLLGSRIASGELHEIKAIPTSLSVAQDARAAGIPLTTFSAHRTIDITIDGADEVDGELNLIKGGGGALLKEKIVAQATRREIIVVDGTKLSSVLGVRFPLPVEVLPFGWELQLEYLESLGASVELRTTSDGEIFNTDSGNLVLDCHFGPIENPQVLAQALAQRAGIVEHGLFLGFAHDLVVADGQGVRHQARSEK
jgi:ribose 5-phosphate isomerase A